jgi:hypothetical protein
MGAKPRTREADAEQLRFSMIVRASGASWRDRTGAGVWRQQTAKPMQSDCPLPEATSAISAARRYFGPVEGHTRPTVDLEVQLKDEYNRQKSA